MSMDYYEMRAKQKAAEVMTIAPRALTLNLSDADAERIALYAAKGGMTVAQLLESFIGDLVDGTYSNGSDERDYAEQWYERCGFTFMTSSDVARLAGWDVLEDMADACDAYVTGVEEVADLKKELAKGAEDTTEEDLKSTQEWLADCRKDIEENMRGAGCVCRYLLCKIN